MSQCIPGLHAHQLARYRQRVSETPALLDSDVLAPEPVAKERAAANITWRQRHFPPHVTLWTFLLQVLSADGSCREAVTRMRALRVARGQMPPSPNTGSSCKARRRLPETVVARLAQEAGQRLSQPAPDHWRWKGRRVKVVDGTTGSMPDTPAHQAAYPQQTQQQPGLGFPIARVLGMFCLASGSLVSLASGRYRGKETGEPALLRQVVPTLTPGEVVLGDRCDSSYCMLAELQARGVDYVGRQHQRRKTDFRHGTRLGREDHIVCWHKPVCPAWLDEATYEQMPEQVHVRELRVRVTRKGFRTKVLIVVTTLLNPKAFRKDDLAELYRSRWHAELDLRARKIALGMDVLRGKTPEIVRKEMWMSLLAYNLIRAVMAKAAASAGLIPGTLRFSGALQAVNVFGHALLFAADTVRDALLEALYSTIAAHRVGQRSDRVEPRAVKRRPKPHALLTVPRDEARQQLMQGRAA